jgi:tetratricopeptide (TPR) repeat protein
LGVHIGGASDAAWHGIGKSFAKVVVVRRCALGAISAALLLSGCADVGGDGFGGGKEPIEKPDPQVAAKMSLGEAKDIIQRGRRYVWSDGAADHDTQIIEFTDKLIENSVYKRDGSTSKEFACPYETFDPFVLPAKTAGVGLHKGSPLYEAWSRIRGNECLSLVVGVRSREAANEAATAFLRWKMTTLAERQAWPAQEQRQFATIVATYRAATPTPVISADVRRFRIIAESAVRQKRFSDAVDAYEDGLKLAPRWPEGQFNAALMLGELRYYDEAIDHMKKYLALEPAASNARAAQDKIYVWEGDRRAVQ